MVYMNDDSTLPPPVDTGEISSDDDGQPKKIAAPARLTLPDKLSRLPSVNMAAAIVKEFEEYVKIGDDVFSPMRLWTRAARQAAGAEMMKQTSLFGRRAQLYLFILSLETDPASLTLTGKELAEGKKTWMQALPEAEKDGQNFELAARVAAERVEQRAGAERLADLMQEG